MPRESQSPSRDLVSYSKDDHVVTIQTRTCHLTLPAGSKTALLGDKKITLPRAPTAGVNGNQGTTMMIPLAPVLQALGAEVRYDRGTDKTYVDW